MEDAESSQGSEDIDTMLLRLRKDLRRYRKSLRHINDTEKRKSEGKSLDKDQESLISKKPSIAGLVDVLENLVQYAEDLKRQKVQAVEPKEKRAPNIIFGSIDIEKIPDLKLQKSKNEEERQCKAQIQGDGNKIYGSTKEQVMPCNVYQQSNASGTVQNIKSTLAEIVKTDISKFWLMDDNGKVYDMAPPFQNMICSILRELISLHNNGFSHEDVGNLKNIVLVQNSMTNAKLINIKNKHCANCTGIAADYAGLKNMILNVMNEHNISQLDVPQDLQDFLYLLDRPLSPVKNREIIQNHPALWDSKTRVQFIVNLARKMSAEPALDYKIRRWLANERELKNWFYSIPKAGKLQKMLKATPGSFFFYYTTEATDLIRYMRRAYAYIIEHGPGKREEEKLSLEAAETIFHKLFPHLLIVLHRRLA